jgi:hypothetical protein
MDVKHAKERTDTRLKEFQRENHELQSDIANLQGQLHQQEFRHNQELAIALHGINGNTRHIGDLNQQMGNPLDRPQHPANSNESSGSRLPSTFHSAASKDHPLVPLASPMAPARSNPREGHQQPEANPAIFQDDAEASHNL